MEHESRESRRDIEFDGFHRRTFGGRSVKKRFGPSIFGRFGLTFLVLVAIPSLAMLFFFSHLVVDSLYKVSASQARETGAQILRNLYSESEMVSYQTSALLYDQDLRANVQRYVEAPSETERVLAVNAIDRNLINFFNYNNKAGAVALLMKNGDWYSYGNLSNLGGKPPEGASFLKEARANPGKVVFSDGLDGLREGNGIGSVLTAALVPDRSDTSSDLKMILLMVRVPFLDYLRTPSDQQDKTEVVLVGRRGQVLLSTLDRPTFEALSHETNLRSPLGERTMDLAGKVWLTSRRRVEGADWILITLRNEADLTRKFQTYDQLLMTGLGLLTLLFLVYTAFFFSGIALPIQEVVKHMNLVGEGAWGINIESQGLKELTVLVDSFNQMSNEIVRLNKERLSLELDVLRYQINPHFVANTLNVIRLMARTARAKGIDEMTGDLMVLLADSYAGGQSLTELASEVRVVESYVRIMKIRFAKGFQLVVEPLEDRADCLMLRMLLQPLVENALIHGFAGLNRRGNITVRSRLEDRPEPPDVAAPRIEEGVKRQPGRLVVEVEDDGVGMPAEKAALVRSDPLTEGDRFARIGLTNVDRRIQLHFGEDCGLTIESEPGFTRVRLTLPVLRREQDA